MAVLVRDGVSIFYEVSGQGPPVLLSHGYSASSRYWRGQVEALADGHTVITWDMRGHGRSDSPADQAAYSETATVADLKAVMQAAGFERAVLGGHSLGGYMSLAFNRIHPQAVEALMIVDTGPGYRSDEARAGWNQRAEKTAQRFESEVAAPVDPERPRSLLGLARAARGMLAQRDAAVLESLPSITVPTLVVVGANDTPFLAAAGYMAAKIPGARQVVVADAGHDVNIDQPAAFNAAMLDFLGGLPR